MLLKYRLLCLFFAISSILLAQDEDVLRENFIEAEYHYLYEEFDDALDLYLENYKYDSTNSNLNYRIGQSILHLTDNNRFKREDAILFLERATENMTDQYNEGSFKENKAPYEALFYLGNAHRYNHEFDKAVVVYERFISYLPPTDYFYIDFVKRESQACHNAKELISVPVGFEIESLNDIVNSDAKVENCPVVNYEEDVIVYTSGKNNTFSPDINMAAMNVDYKMDNIYFTHFTDTGWTQPIIINEEIKAGKHAVPTSITGDGKTLYVVRDDNDNGNIYVTSYERDKWTKMRKLNKNINSSNWESHASITEDGKTLFFTSDRPGGYGGLDVYKSEFDEEAQDWGPAINLGPTINSIYDEETPYVVNNGKVLYFSSQGHYGMGGFDIFYSSLLDNGNWTSPMNLGYPLNTVGNDLFYLPRRNGEYAIFPLNNNDRGTMQTNDIFRIKVPTPGTDSTEIEFKGIMGIEDNNWPLYSGAKITIINNDNGDTLNFVNVNLDNGAYKTVISAGSFKVNYFAPGYEPRTEYVLIPKIFAKTEFTLNVTLKPIAVSKGQYYVIKNVFFDYGKSDLTKEAQIEIEKLHDIMTENTDLYIEVIGYTDAVSNAEFNQKLSERRAKSVVDYLITKGISSQRFVAVGKGESNPIAINNNPDGSDNPEGRQLNRRVEIKLMNYNGDRIVVEEIKVPKKLKYQNQASSLLWIVADQALTKQELESKLPSTVDVEKLKSVLQKQEEDKYYFYLTGYPSKADALKDLNALVDAGFKNAQIVEKTSTDEIIAKPEIESGEFTIQIKALRQKVEPSTFTKLSNVEVYKGKDGFYRYVYGSYATRQEALDAKKSIGDEQELKDAFIILVKNLKKY